MTWAYGSFLITGEVRLCHIEKTPNAASTRITTMKENTLRQRVLPFYTTGYETLPSHGWISLKGCSVYSYILADPNIPHCYTATASRGILDQLTKTRADAVLVAAYQRDQVWDRLLEDLVHNHRNQEANLSSNAVPFIPISFERIVLLFEHETAEIANHMKVFQLMPLTTSFIFVQTQQRVSPWQRSLDNSQAGYNWLIAAPISAFRVLKKMLVIRRLMLESLIWRNTSTSEAKQVTQYHIFKIIHSIFTVMCSILFSLL